MRQRVVFAAALRAAAPGAALIEQHRMEALGIEQPPVVGLAAAAGAAMQIDRRDAVGAADGFDIDLVAVADRQQLRGQRRERIGAVAADLPASASGAMVAVRLQRAAGEIAIEEAVVVGRRLAARPA